MKNGDAREDVNGPVWSRFHVFTFHESILSFPSITTGFALLAADLAAAPGLGHAFSPFVTAGVGYCV